MTNFAKSSGSGLSSYSGSVTTVDGCVFEGNLIGNTGFALGGALYSSGTVLVVDTEFIDNTSTSLAGGFAHYGFEAFSTVLDCLFSGNSAESGGGMSVFGGEAFFSGCTFIGNSATSDGGGGQHWGGEGLLVFDECVFSSNDAARGGAIHVEGVTVVDATAFSGNTSTAGGGAITSLGPLELESCTFVDNSTDQRGGAINNSGELVAADCIFEGNAAIGDGGAVFDYAAVSLQLINCEFEANTTGGVAGAVFTTEGFPCIESCLFRDNEAALWAGGLYVIQTAAEIIDCEFTGNLAGDHGGGLLVLSGEATVRRSRFEANAAALSGGGVQNWSNATLTLIECDFFGNASAEGAAVMNDGGSLFLYSCTLNGNLADFIGGGLSNTAGGTAEVNNCSFSGNVAGLLGGAVSAAESGDVDLRGCTVIGNDSGLFGGGVYVYGTSTATVSNCVLFFNSDATGMNEAAQLGGLDPSAIGLGYSCVQGLTGLYGGDGNIDDDPMVRDPAGADGMAGTADDDLRLEAGSPCIDAGDNEAVPADLADLDGDNDTLEPVPFDLDGHTRFFDDVTVPDSGNAPGGGPIVDMGAYEFDGEPVAWIGPAGGSWFVAANWSNGQLPGGLSDIVLAGSVVVDGAGAEARDITILAGGELRIGDGSLTAVNIMVLAGGALVLDHADADLAVTTLTAQPGAEVVWNAGLIEIAAGGAWVQSAPIAFGCEGPGTLVLAGQTLVEAPSVEVCALGELRGAGTVRSDVVNAGLVSPGFPVGQLTIDGNYAQSSSGLLLIEIVRLDPSIDHDVLTVLDDIAIAGTLGVEPFSGFDPQLGLMDVVMSADAITGTFDTLDLSTVSDLILFQVTQDETNVSVRVTAPTPRLYVAANAPADGYGTAWLSPFQDLQSALAAAVRVEGDVNEIWVAEGTYVPSAPTLAEDPRSSTFLMIDGVSLYGGFAGDESDPDQRDIPAHPSVLSGDLNGDDGPDFAYTDENSYHVVAAEELESTLIVDGFTITAGHANGFSGGALHFGDGGGLWIYDCDADIRNCVFTLNADGLSHQSYGGALYVFWGDATVTNCRFAQNHGGKGGALYMSTGKLVVNDCDFEDNQAFDRGGAIYCNVAEMTIADCRMVANISQLHGGGINLYRSTGSLTNCQLLDNEVLHSSGSGGAIYTLWSNSRLRDCIVAGNDARPNGGAIYNEESSQVIENCTIANNIICGGIVNHESSLRISNSVLWLNSDDPDEFSELLSQSNASVLINYCCVAGWTGNLGGVGNFGDDPLFADIDGPDDVRGNADDDLHLTEFSPCVNAGPFPAEVDDEAHDVDGDPRVQMCRIDIGGDESPWALFVDCNATGTIDVCDIADGLSDDCNGNAIPDECEIAAGDAEDCNANGIPDECEAVDIIHESSGPLSPIGGDSPQSFVLFGAPLAVSDVVLEFAAEADLLATSDHIDVDINGVVVGVLFEFGAQNCPAFPNLATLTVAAATFNDAIGTDGYAAINMVPASGVFSGACDGESFIAVEIRYAATSAADHDGDGILTECECPWDLNGDGEVEIVDLLVLLGAWGTDPGGPPDFDGGGVGITDFLILLTNWGPCP